MTLLELQFQLTRLMRGVTYIVDILFLPDIISTHTPHARRDDNYKSITFRCLFISTHTPHARRDAESPLRCAASAISTHTPHARRDRLSATVSAVQRQFQLTRLMRGVT